MAAASASAAPGTRAVPAAITFGNVDAAAFASTQGVALVAASLASTIASAQPGATNVSVQVTRITDVASGVVVFSLSGARRQRRLQQGAGAGASGVMVAFVVQVPATAPAGAETGVASLLQPAVGGGASAGFAAFATQAVVSIAAAASSAGNTALAAGIAGAAVTVAAPAASAAAIEAGASSNNAVALGVGLGVSFAILVAAGVVFYFRTSLAGCFTTRTGAAAGGGTGPITVIGSPDAPAAGAKSTTSASDSSSFSTVNPRFAPAPLGATR